MQWLRDLGFVRVMAPVGDEVLVWGKWHEGHYPIQWQKGSKKREWNSWAGSYMTFTTKDEWRLFGIVCAALTDADVRRIIEAIGENK